MPPSAPFNNATFVYDGDGKRVKSTFNGTTTTYFVGAHYEVTGSIITKYYYAGSQRIAMRTNGTVNYLLVDHLGSTSLTTNASGQVVSELRYKAWGETRYASGNAPTKYQYTGQFSESDFGLYFYNARWYDPYLNHFTQPDTIVPNPYNSQDWDRYSYVQNNPIRYIDPTGHKNCKEDGYNCPGDNYTGTLPPGIDQEHHDRLHRLRYQAELLSLRMQEGEITDIDSLRLLFEFAEVTYGDDIDGALMDLGIVVGGLDTTGIIPRQINRQDPNERLLQYYIGNPAFDPIRTSFSQELNPRHHNQVRHFLAGAAGGNAPTGALGRMYLLVQEPEPEDDLLYTRAFAFVDFLAIHPLSEAGSWIQENLVP